MTVETWNNPVYLICRFALWTLVWSACLYDFIKHKGEKVHGWQLHRCIFIVLTLQVFKEMMGLIWQFAFSDGTKASTIFYYVVIFFYDLGDATFFCLLMVISYGWMITRTNFGPDSQPIFVAPAVNFIAILAHDFIWERAGGHHGACYIRLKDVESDIMLIATLAYLFTIIYIWMWIFQAVKIEKLRLEEKMYVGKVTAIQEEGAAPIAAPNAIPFPGSTAQTASVMERMDSTDEAGDITRQVIDTPATDDDLDLMTPDTNYTETAADEDDTAMPLLSKYRLLLVFFNAVSIFFTAICAVIVCQIWTTKCEFSEEGYTIAVTASRITLLCIRDFVYIGFSAALAYIFRLRERNPYFMLDDYNTNLFDEDSDVDAPTVQMGAIDNASSA